MTIKAPPIDFDGIRIGLVRAAIEATGLDQNHVITAEAEVPNAPRPDLPYMAFKLTTAGMRWGEDSSAQVQGPGPNARELRGPRLVVASFNTYGTSHEEAYGVMALWQASLPLPNVRAILDAAGISVLMPGAIRDLTALMDSAYEGRAQMDLRLCVRSGITYDAGRIAAAEVAGVVTAGEDAAPSTIDTGSITFGGGQ